MDPQSFAVNQLLQNYERFGVDLGLDRILHLLHRLGNPHRRVPVIHVAGTNGKGSVCAYLSSVLTAAGFQVGRYTSPHLVEWQERITLNEIAVFEAVLLEALQQVEAAIDPAQPIPTQFEVLTAAAWFIFAEATVDVAVIEVGLGGRLDATNVCDSPLATIITSISREHWQRLGSTLAEIAGEKAGILKAGCPAFLGPLPAEAAEVIQKKVEALSCSSQWVMPARWLPDRQDIPPWATTGEISYPLPLAGDMQLANSALAIATLQLLQEKGWSIPEEVIQLGMAKTLWPGRIQWTEWEGQKLLIDGAHNPAAAKILRQYLDQCCLAQPIHWLIGMLSTKDHREIFEALLRPGDSLMVVPVKDHSTAAPEELAELALEVCPDLERCSLAHSLQEALQLMKTEQSSSKYVSVLCGSLYLIGEFLDLEKAT